MLFDTNIDEQLPRPGIYGERKQERKSFETPVQQELKNYLARIKHLQDVEYDATSENHETKEKAFIAALDIMQQWLDKSKHNVGTTTLEGERIEARASRANAFPFAGVKVLVWVEDDQRNKFFYTIDHLKSLDLRTIQQQVAGLDKLYEEYSGNVRDDYRDLVGTRIPNKVGLQFFRRRNQSEMFRKVPKATVPEF